MPTVDSDVVRLERTDGIARIVLDDPDRRNALSVELAHGIIDSVRALEATDTRVVVLEGAGPAFCAGGDIDAMIERAETDAPLDEAVRHIVRNTGRAIKVIAECPFPTVARIDGPAFGAGANLAIACDVQVCRESASIGFGFRNVGLSVDSGTSVLLPRLVGDNVARELVYTGELVEGPRAEELGIVNHCYPDETFDEETAALIETIAEGPTVALRHSKQLLSRGWNRSLGEAIEAEADAQAVALDSRDHEEGVTAFTEKRDPEFEGR